MNCNYKVNIKDIQNKYKFNIFAMGGYNDSDLRKMIESVFYALPRTSGSGASVTLNDTARSYMHNELNATDTSQDTTTGKNKFNKNATVLGHPNCSYTFNNGVFTLTNTNNNNFALELELNLPAGAYILNSDTFLSESTQLRNTNLSPQVQHNFAGEYKNQGFTISNDINKIVFNYGTTSTPITLDLNTLMIRASGTSADYEEYTGGIASPNPDYPQVIHTINGNNTIKVEGKNLVNTLTRNGNTVYIGDINTPTFIFEAGTYTVSYESSKTIGTYIQKESDATSTNLGNNKTITFTSNEKFCIWFWQSGLLVEDIIHCQLEKGNQATTFEPYQSNSVLLTLGDKEICKIRDYEDKIFKAIKGNEVYDSLASEEKATLDYGKWYLRKNIGKVVLNGSENWATLQSYNGFYRTSISISDINIPSVNSTNLYSNYFYGNLGAVSGNNVNLGMMAQFRNTSNVYFITNETTMNNYKSWLSTHNTIVYYILATPTNELFNDTIQDQLEDIYNNMLSYEGQTNVSQVNDDLPFNINSTAIKDLNDL